MITYQMSVSWESSGQARGSRQTREHPEDTIAPTLAPLPWRLPGLPRKQHVGLLPVGEPQPDPLRIACRFVPSFRRKVYQIAKELVGGHWGITSPRGRPHWGMFGMRQQRVVPIGIRGAELSTRITRGIENIHLSSPAAAVRDHRDRCRAGASLNVLEGPLHSAMIVSSAYAPVTLGEHVRRNWARTSAGSDRRPVPRALPSRSHPGPQTSGPDQVFRRPPGASVVHTRLIANPPPRAWFPSRSDSHGPSNHKLLRRQGASSARVRNASAAGRPVTRPSSASGREWVGGFRLADHAVTPSNPEPAPDVALGAKNLVGPCLDGRSAVEQPDAAEAGP